jgi:hypothetical protein
MNKGEGKAYIGKGMMNDSLAEGLQSRSPQLQFPIISNTSISPTTRSTDLPAAWDLFAEETARGLEFCDRKCFLARSAHSAASFKLRTAPLAVPRGVSTDASMLLENLETALCRQESTFVPTVMF